MVEIDPLLLFAGVGMISVGLVSMIYWSKKAKFRYFVFGGLLWLSAISVKLAMDFTVTPKLNSWLISSFGNTIVTSMWAGLYVGLRTGLFECGFPYLTFLKLVMYAVKEGNRRYFAVSFGYKSLLDGAIPLLNFLTPTKTLTEMYLIEIPVVIFGTIGIFGVRLMKRRLGIV